MNFSLHGKIFTEAQLRAVPRAIWYPDHGTNIPHDIVRVQHYTALWVLLLPTQTMPERFPWFPTHWDPAETHEEYADRLASVVDKTRRGSSLH